ncbi:MAG TPA: GNAT family N-acetyltransferase [Acidimicrobiia bacterium]
MNLTVRRIGIDDGELLRTQRLAALLDAPSAFGSTYEAEVGRSLDDWNERARFSADGCDRVTYFAVLDREVVGLVGGFKSQPDGLVVDLVSMWAAPSVRREGVGRALVDAVIEWSRKSGATSVELWVARGNEPAQRLYESCGFAETNVVAPLASDPCRDQLRMRREL